MGLKAYAIHAGVFCTMACGAAAAVAQDGASKEAAWRDYTYPADAFVIAAPVEPKQLQRTLRVFGGSAEGHIYAVKAGDKGALIVFVAQRQPSDQRSDQDVLDQARVGVLTTAHAIVSVQAKETIGDHRGAQIELEAVDGNGAHKRVRDRIFVVGRRLYQLMAITSAGEPLPADSERWFASFRLVNDSDALRPSLR